LFVPTGECLVLRLTAEFGTSASLP